MLGCEYAILYAVNDGLIDAELLGDLLWFHEPL
jgi:hypothetical protein